MPFGGGGTTVDSVHLLVLLISAAFTENILLFRFLGVCPALACSRRRDVAAGLGWAVLFITTCTAALNHLLDTHVLVPFDLGHLRLVLFIAVIAAFVQFIEMVMDRWFPRLYHGLGIFLPLITVNCAILGTSLFMVMREMNLVEATVYGFGSGLGWMLAIRLMASLRDAVNDARVPRPFRGVPLALILIGILAMIVRGLIAVATT